VLLKSIPNDLAYVLALSFEVGDSTPGIVSNAYLVLAIIAGCPDSVLVVFVNESRTCWNASES
jgi:hypothetical protein